MAVFRGVKRHENSRMWAFLEWSDENPNHFKLLGSKEFGTKEEAEEYSLGFAVDSYEWVEPSEIKLKRLTSEKAKLEQRLLEIQKELDE